MQIQIKIQVHIFTTHALLNQVLDDAQGAEYEYKYKGRYKYKYKCK